MATFGTKYLEPGPWNSDGLPGNRLAGRGRTATLKATPRQYAYLSHLGYEGPWELTRSQASELIDTIKQHRKREHKKRT